MGFGYDYYYTADGWRRRRRCRPLLEIDLTLPRRAIRLGPFFSIYFNVERLLLLCLCCLSSFFIFLLLRLLLHRRIFERIIFRRMLIFHFEASFFCLLSGCWLLPSLGRARVVCALWISKQPRNKSSFGITLADVNKIAGFEVKWTKSTSGEMFFFFFFFCGLLHLYSTICTSSTYVPCSCSEPRQSRDGASEDASTFRHSVWQICAAVSIYICFFIYSFAVIVGHSNKKGRKCFIYLFCFLYIQRSFCPPSLSNLLVGKIGVWRRRWRKKPPKPVDIVVCAGKNIVAPYIYIYILVAGSLFLSGRCFTFYMLRYIYLFSIPCILKIFFSGNKWKYKYKVYRKVISLSLSLLLLMLLLLFASSRLLFSCTSFFANSIQTKRQNEIIYEKPKRK